MSGSNGPAPLGRERVWDVPTRVFHWVLAGCFTGAWLLSESEQFRAVHVGLGYATAALVLLRVVWGVAGTRYARFASFVRGPRAAVAYLRDLVAGRAPHHAGHNPAGGLAVVALLVLAAATAVSGWATLNEYGGERVAELHEVIAGTWLAAVVVHLAGVLVGSLAHRENLARAMVTGWKRARPGEGIDRTYAWGGVLVLGAAVAAFAWGAGLWGGTPGAAETAVAADLGAAHHRDDD
jgi:cytochrome b